MIAKFLSRLPLSTDENSGYHKYRVPQTIRYVVGKVEERVPRYQVFSAVGEANGALR